MKHELVLGQIGAEPVGMLQALSLSINMFFFRFFSLASFSVMLSSCAINVSVLSIQVEDTVQERPTMSFGPSRPEKGRPWRKITVEFTKDQLSSIWRSNSTFLLEFNDCAGKRLLIEDVYVEGYPLNRLLSLSLTESEGKFSGTRDKVLGVAYLEEKVFSAEARICGRLIGGNMTGAKIKSGQARIK